MKKSDASPSQYTTYELLLSPQDEHRTNTPKAALHSHRLRHTTLPSPSCTPRIAGHGSTLPLTGHGLPQGLYFVTGPVFCGRHSTRGKFSISSQKVDKADTNPSFTESFLVYLSAINSVM